MAETAREFFEAVAEAVRDHRAAELILAYGRPRIQGVGRSGMSNPVEARFESDEAAREVMAATEEIIGEGLKRIEEIRLKAEYTADIIDMHYIDLLTWHQIIDVLNDGRGEEEFKERTIKRWCSNIFAAIDEKGWAWLRNCETDLTSVAR